MSLTIYTGDDKTWDVQVTRDGAALDLTGLIAATFLVKAQVADADAAALITKTLGAGIAVTNAAGGTLTVTLAAADTARLGDRSLACALKLKDAAGKTHTVYNGPLAVVLPAVVAAV